MKITLTAAALPAMGALCACFASVVLPQDRLALADRERESGMYSEALEDYSLLIGDESVPQGRLFLCIGEVAEKLGRAPAASNAYAKAVSVSGDTAVADFARLRLAVMEGGDGSVPALRSLSESAGAAEVRASALFHLASALEKPSPAEAIAAYDRLLAMKGVPPGYVHYARLRNAALLSASSDAAARRRAIGHYAELMADKTTPRHVLECAIYYAAQLALRDGRYGESQALFARLERDFPGGRYSADAAEPHAWAACLNGQDQAVLDITSKACSAESGPSDHILYLRAGALHRLARNEEAAAAYARLLRRDPRGRFAADAATGYIEAKRDAGDFAGALAFLKENAAYSAGFTARAWCAACRCAIAAGDPEAAIQCARSAAAGDDAEWARTGAFLLGDALARSGAHRQAAAAYRAAASKWPGEREFAAAALLRAGACEEISGDAEAALRDFTAVLREFPGTKAAPEALYRKGAAELRGSAWSSAADSFDDLAARFPDSPRLAEALHWSGVARHMLGNRTLAEARERAALEASPPPALEAEIRMSLGAILRESGRNEEALAEYSRAIGSASSPAGPSTLSWMAASFMESGRLEAAGDAVRLLLEQSPDDAWRQAAHALAGDLAEKRGDSALAAKEREAALALPANTVYAARAALALGVSAASAGDASAARKWFAEASAKSASPETLPVRLRAWIGLARLERSAGNDADALRWFMLATTVPGDPELSAEAYAGAAAILESQGRALEAAALRGEAGKKGGE